MSRNVPPKQRLLTSELYSFLIVLAVCLRSIEQTNHIPENLNDVRFRAKMWMWLFSIFARSTSTFDTLLDIPSD